MTYMTRGGGASEEIKSVVTSLMDGPELLLKKFVDKMWNAGRILRVSIWIYRAKGSDPSRVPQISI